MKLYHVGYEEIKNPDINYGRKIADFGQGFYLSLERSFSEKWAHFRNGLTTYLNIYDLNEENLKIKTFQKDEEWYHYIFNNRNGYKDNLTEFDVVIGPIANDTIYDVWGILTSGFISPENSLEVLRLGESYTQVVIKSEKANDNLKWISSEILDKNDIIKYQEIVKLEESKYQDSVIKILGKDFNDLFD